MGSGDGHFMKEVKERGLSVTGLEVNPERALKSGSFCGVAESCPFPDSSFDFINLSEVIEHVNDPEKVLSEVKRLLAPGGIAYISVPSRFSLRDPHYHIYLINWLPRRVADSFLDWSNKSKDDLSNGRQRLGEMNYYTYRDFRRVCEKIGLEAVDSRPVPKGLGWVYTKFRWLLTTFHFFVRHSSN